MTYAVHFLPQVQTDLLHGRAWYEGKTSGLGEEFLQLFYNSGEELASNPEMYPKVHKDFRRRLLRRFPYAVYFRIEGDRVVVFGLYHCARDPRRLRKELGDRQQQ